MNPALVKPTLAQLNPKSIGKQNRLQWQDAMIRQLDERRNSYGAVVNEFNNYVNNFENFVKEKSTKPQQSEVKPTQGRSFSVLINPKKQDSETNLSNKLPNIELLR